MADLLNADQLEAAVLTAFSQLPDHDPNARLQATNVCEQVKQSPKGYLMCLERLLQPATMQGPQEVRFWCLDVAQHAIDKRYGVMGEDERAFIRHCLMTIVKSGLIVAPQPPFVKNKLAVAIIRVVKIDYPERWPTFFTEFLDLISSTSNPHHIEVFLRCLQVFDEEVVVFDANRSTQEVEHNTLIKDTLRGTCMERIILMMQGVLEGCLNGAGGDEGLIAVATLTLTVLNEYIGWNDINLCANQRFVNVLYRLMHHECLRTLAVECMREIVYKRMFAERKLMLLKHLNLLSILNTIDPNQDDTDFIREVSSLLSTLGLQLMLCTVCGRKTLKDNRVDDPLSPEVDQEALTQMQEAAEVGFRYLGHSNHRVAEQVVEFYIAYINLLKQGAVKQDDHAHARRIFGCITKGLEFPNWFAHDDQGDDETAFQLFRSELSKALLNLLRGTAYNGLGFMKELAGGLLEDMQSAGNSVPHARVEACLHALYILCEAIKMSDLEQDADIWQLLFHLISSPYFRNPSLNPQCQISYFQLCRRYPTLFTRFPAAISPVVTCFVDERGLGNPNPTARSQACYLLFKLVASFPKPLLSTMQPFVEALLKALQCAIAPFFVQLARQLQSGSSTPVAESESGDHTVAVLEANEIQYLCELLGILTGVSVTGAQCRSHYGEVLRFFQEQLEGTLRSKEQWITNEVLCEIAGDCLRHAIDAIGHYSKSLDPGTRKIVLDLLEHPLETVLKAYVSLPKHEGVRSAVIFFLHRMTDVLQEHVLPYLPKCLEMLLAHSEPSRLLPVLQLINQCITKFKGAIAPTVDLLFVSIISTTTEAIKSYAYVDGAKEAYTADDQERLVLFKVYYSFIKLVLSHSPQVLTSERNNPHLQGVLDSVMSGCLHPEDAIVNKSCVRILFLFIQTWEKSGTTTNPHVQQFLIKDLTSQSFQSAQAQWLDPKDAATAALFREVINVQLAVLKLFKQPYLNHVGEQLVGQGWPQQIAQEYCILLTKGDLKGLRQLLTRVMEEQRKHHPR